MSASDPSGNRSAESNQVTATTPASVPPATPANLRARRARRVNTLTLAWDAVAGAARYELHSNVAGTYSTTATSHTAHWLQPDTGYTFTVRAFNAAGTASAASAPLTVRTLRDTTAPSVPGRLGQRLQPVRGPADLAGVDRQLQLRLLQRRRQRRPWPHMLPGDNTTMAVRNLRDGTTYDFSVRAYDASGNFSAAGPRHRHHAREPGHDAAARADQPGQRRASRRTPSTSLGPWSGFADIFAHEIHMDGDVPARGRRRLALRRACCSRGQVRHLRPARRTRSPSRNRDEARQPVRAVATPVTVTLPPSTDTTPPPRRPG